VVVAGGDETFILGSSDRASKSARNGELCDIDGVKVDRHEK
jgi:hypothetical protein